MGIEVLGSHFESSGERGISAELIKLLLSLLLWVRNYGSR